MAIKLNKKQILLIITAALAVIAVAAVLIVVLQVGRKSDAPAADSVQLFWNVDRDTYIKDSETGFTSTRSADKSDGYYHISFASDEGRRVTRRVAEKSLVNEIDSERVMGLISDNEGIVTGIIRVDDFTGGLVADMFYVAEVKGNMAVVNSSLTMNGVEEEIKWNSGTKIIDVSGYSGDPGTIVSTLWADDRIVAVQNSDGDITHIFIIYRQDMSENHEAYCQHCGETVLWKAWINESSLPTRVGGRYKHYYLSTDVKLSGQMSIRSDQHICLDLNGHTVDGAYNKRIYSLHEAGAELAIMDTSEGKNGKLISHGDAAAEGSVVWVRYGKFTLYSGTLDASDFTNQLNGGTVCVEKEMLFEMRGGTIIGGTARGNRYNKTTGELASHGGLGGNIYVKGTFDMYDGLVTGGRALCVEYVDNEGKTIRSLGYGGNIYIGNEGVFNMKGGTVSDGEAAMGGGNISTEANTKTGGGSVVNMTGGTITGGKNLLENKNGGSILITKGVVFNLSDGLIKNGVSQNCGGNICLNGGGTLNITGGTITGGSCVSTAGDGPRSGNIFANKGTINMSGGTVVGGFDIATVQEYTVLNLSGTARITGALTNLYIPQGKLINVGNLAKGAQISVTAVGYFTDVVDKARISFFTTDTSELNIQYLNNRMFIGQYHCVCSGTHPQNHVCIDVPFIPWTSSTGLPTTSGRYYLTKDVTLKSQSNIQKSADIVLCLNGHTVTSAAGKRIYMLNSSEASLTITDCGSGRMVMGGNFEGEGGLIHINEGSLNIYAGTFASGGFASTDKTGGLIRATAKANINMYGGTVTGGRGRVGGNISNSGVFNMYGGLITGGASTVEGGGNVYNSAVGVFNLSNGTITGGCAVSGKSGGNIYNEGTLNMTGGTVTDGRAYSGANINNVSKSFANIYGGIISGGASENFGGNIANGGTLNLFGGNIESGSAVMGGGNINSSGTLNLIGGSIASGVSSGAASQGGNIRNYGALNISGGTVTGGSAPLGGGIYYGNNNNNIVTLSGAFEIKDNSGSDFYIAKNTQKIIISDFTDEFSFNFQMAAPGDFAEVKAADAAELVSLYNLKTRFLAGDEHKVISCVDVESNTVTFKAVAADAHTHCICGGTLENGSVLADSSVHYCSDIVYTKTNTIPNKTGHYYLEQDITLASQINNSGTSVGKVDLCLNGHTVTSGAGKRVYMLNSADAALTITDHSGNTAGALLKNGNSSAEGGVIHIENGTLNIYNGTLDGNGFAITAKTGGVIRVAKNGTLNMYGGIVTGGSVTGGTDLKGGNISVTGVFNMPGGTVQNGSSAKGANILVIGTFNMYGGSVSGGTSVSGNGGNIEIDNTGTFNMHGGLVTGGTAGGTTGSGGNIWINLGKFNMSGGTVTGGKSMGTNNTAKRSHNIFNNAGGFNMSGGEIDGYVELMGSFTAAISGSARISGGTVNLYVPDGKTVDFGKLSEGACIYVSSGSSADKIVIAEKFEGDVLSYVFPDNPAYIAATEDKKLTLLKQ